MKLFASQGLDRNESGQQIRKNCFAAETHLTTETMHREAIVAFSVKKSSSNLLSCAAPLFEKKGSASRLHCFWIDRTQSERAKAGVKIADDLIRDISQSTFF
jgi:hypothetical protein